MTVQIKEHCFESEYRLLDNWRLSNADHLLIWNMMAYRIIGIEPSEAEAKRMAELQKGSA